MNLCDVFPSVEHQGSRRLIASGALLHTDEVASDALSDDNRDCGTRPIRVTVLKYC